MSVASVQQSQAYQLDDFGAYSYTEATFVSIEEIRLQLYSCFTCGVSWLLDHVCLDCTECGGYSLKRPCPQCDGQCGSYWKRDLTTSHACGKARWNGECLMKNIETEKTTSRKEKDS